MNWASSTEHTMKKTEALDPNEPEGLECVTCQAGKNERLTVKESGSKVNVKMRIRIR